MPLPQVGETFGRYRIDGLVGTGGMGAVYLATDPSLRRQVAIKVVAEGGDQDEQRFEREAETLASLDSPHVITVHDYGERDGQRFIVTQYVAGGDLRALVAQRGPLPPYVAAELCAQVAAGLADAHRAGIIHRDVKPANVLIRDPERPVPSALLCDFGVARTGTEVTRPGTVTGTWAYLAPECGRGEPATAVSDVYSLGCVLWFALTGSAPYVGSEVEVAIAHQQQAVPQLGPEVPHAADINPVLQALLAKKPEKRYADADVARVAVERLASTLGAEDATLARGALPAAVMAGPMARTEPTGTTGTTGRGRRTGVLVGAVVAIVVVAAGITLGVTRPWHHGAGAATASPGSTAPTPASARIAGPATGDLDGDGHGDVYGDFDDTSGFNVIGHATWRWDGSGFTEVGAPPLVKGRGVGNDWKWGDLDGDGKPEMTTWVATKTGWKISADLSSGKQLATTLAYPPEYDPVLDRGENAFADVNNDGHADVIQSMTMGFKKAKKISFYVSLWSGDGWAKPTKMLTIPIANAALDQWTSGDFNGDGKTDLAFAYQTSMADNGPVPLTVMVFRGNGQAFVRSHTTTYPAHALGQLLAADVDGDGSDEMVVVTFLNQVGHLRVLRPTDLHPASAGDEAFPAGADHGTLTVADVDGDGRDDVVGVSVATKLTADYESKPVGKATFFVSYARNGTLQPGRLVGSVRTPTSAGFISLEGRAVFTG